MKIELKFTEDDLQAMEEFSREYMCGIKEGQHLSAFLQGVILQSYATFLPLLEDYFDIMVLTREELDELKRKHGNFESFSDLLHAKLWDVVRDLEVV